MKRILSFLALGAMACAGSPLTLDTASRRPVGDARECVSERVVARGFAITESGGDDGTLRAEGVYERPDTTSFLGLETVETLIEWGRLGATFQASGGRTSISLTAATSGQRGGPWGEPSHYMTVLTEEIAEACS